MLKQTMWLALGFAFVAAVGCSSSSSSGGADDGSSANNATGSVTDYCTESCTKFHGCDKTVDVQTCSNSCKNDFAAVGPKLRDDFLASVTACYGNQDCVAVLDDEALGKCTEEAVAELAPSKAGTTFCTDYENAVAKCDSDFDKADCYDQAKTFSDSALKEAANCLSKACSDIDDCVEATLGEVKDIGGGDSDSGNGTSGSGNGTSGSGNGTSGSGNGTSGSGNGTAGTSSGTGGTGNGTAGSSGTAGTAPVGGTGGSGTLTGPCTTTSPSQCASATSLNTCVGGKYAVVTCKAFLGAIGFASSSCTDDVCNVESVLDADCAAGISAFCQCSDPVCTAAEKVDGYVSCFQDDPAGLQETVQCMADATTCGDVADCIP